MGRYVKGVYNKYQASKVIVDGITFKSKIEAARYRELKMLEIAGKIFHLSIRPRFKISINDYLICHYESDFMYKEEDSIHSPIVIEEVKGFPTREFQLKWKLVLALYGGRYEFRLFPPKLNDVLAKRGSLSPRILLERMRQQNFKVTRDPRGRRKRSSPDDSSGLPKDEG